jgi:arsenate reductase
MEHDSTIYHNPACGTSRNALALMRHAGANPRVVDYLQQPPERERLEQLLRDAGVTVRAAIRTKEPVYASLRLDDPGLSDGQLLEAMLAHPVLIQRPIVETGRGVRICRPSEQVLDLLPPVRLPFAKEDGEVVIDAAGRRLR